MYAVLCDKKQMVLDLRYEIKCIATVFSRASLPSFKFHWLSFYHSISDTSKTLFQTILWPQVEGKWSNQQITVCPWRGRGCHKSESGNFNKNVV